MLDAVEAVPARKDFTIEIEKVVDLTDRIKLKYCQRHSRTMSVIKTIPESCRLKVADRA